jgi:hypothetical protein
MSFSSCWKARESVQRDEATEFKKLSALTLGQMAVGRAKAGKIVQRAAIAGEIGMED